MSSLPTWNTFFLSNNYYMVDVSIEFIQLYLHIIYIVIQLLARLIRIAIITRNFERLT